MSLRAEIRDAVDEVTPPAPALPTQVEAFVHANTRWRVAARSYRTNRWRSVIRGSLAMAAVLVLIALVASVFIGGRLVQDWNALHKPNPAGDTFKSQLAELESRPLLIPRIASSDTCPGPFYQAGPVHMSSGPMSIGPLTTTNRAVYWGVTFDTDAGLTGPVLIRMREARSGDAGVFINQNAAGPVVGTDTVLGQAVQQRAELALDTSHPPSLPDANGRTSWTAVAGTHTYDGCRGWQADWQDGGKDHSAVFYG